MKTIRFIRHAESSANVGLPTTDPGEIPLTENGRQAAAQAAAQYDGPEPDLIVCSPFLRAQQTAEPFIARFPKAKVEDWPVYEFTYISPTRCVGTTANDRRPLVEAYWNAASPTHVDGFGTESFVGFTARVFDALAKLRTRKEECILVVCHGIFMNAAAFYQAVGEKPSDSDSMRRFHQYTIDHPIPNLGIWGYSNLPQLLAEPTGGGADKLHSRHDVDRTSIDHLIRESLAYDTSSKIKELFDFIGNTPVHSPYNAMLLHVQHPQSRMMLSAKNWAKLGRTVRHGARPYVILATMGPVSFVFDESETDGSPIAVPEQGNLFKDAFAVSGNLSETDWNKLLISCAKIGVEVDGWTSRLHSAGQIQAAGPLCRVKINAVHPLEVKFVTLTHELAHLFCGHLGAFKGICPDRSSRNHASDEIEAEATAYLVAKRIGLKSHSQKYISSFLRPGGKVSFSVDAILVAAGKIEAMCKGTFKIRTR